MKNIEQKVQKEIKQLRYKRFLILCKQRGVNPNKDLYKDFLDKKGLFVVDPEEERRMLSVLSYT